MKLRKPTGSARIAALLMTVALLGGAIAYADNGPMETTRQFVDHALKILADKQTPIAQRSEQLRGVIAPNFDFAEMSRSALGYHWKKLSADQRAQFTDTFTAFIESAYSTKIGSYSGQKVDFLRQSSLGAGYAQVFTNIVQPSGGPIAVNYLLKQESGAWKVYDVTVDNISIIANYRNQFNRVINEDGFDKLMADLKAKQKQLNSTLAG